MSVKLDHGERRAGGEPRDQRHAVHRRDAGAADHLHGGRTAGHRRRAGRSAGVDGGAPAKPDTPLYLTLKGDLSFTLKDTPVSREALAKALDEATGGKKDERIFLRADKAVPYGELMQAMNVLRTRGLPARWRWSGWSNEESLRWIGSFAFVLALHAGAIRHRAGLGARRGAVLAAAGRGDELELAPLPAAPEGRAQRGAAGAGAERGDPRARAAAASVENAAAA